MPQNRIDSAMATRSEPRDSLDFFPTPPWATRALCEHVLDLTGTTVWEPACGQGHMSEALMEYASRVISTDVAPYGYGGVRDFFAPNDYEVDWVITNPPFNLAERFALRGFEVARSGVALFVRSVFTEGAGRYERLFSVCPPTIVAQFTERVTLVKNRLADNRISSATAYCWIVWKKLSKQPPTLMWIPPCKAELGG